MSDTREVLVLGELRQPHGYSARPAGSEENLHRCRSWTLNLHVSTRGRVVAGMVIKNHRWEWLPTTVPDVSLLQLSWRDARPGDEVS